MRVIIAKDDCCNKFLSGSLIFIDGVFMLIKIKYLPFIYIFNSFNPDLMMTLVTKPFIICHQTVRQSFDGTPGSIVWQYKHDS